jgi:hypothetical protein
MTTRNWRRKEQKSECEASLRCQKPYVPSTRVVEVFTTVGTTIWSSPINLKDVNIFMVGGGGGGGGSYDTGAGGGLYSLELQIFMVIHPIVLLWVMVVMVVTVFVPILQ